MSSKSSSTRQTKKPLHHLKSKKWCFPPSPLRQTSGGSGSGSTPLLSPSKSPEPNCAICLGKIEDKSFTDRCFHCFCRLCLFEWAKVKAECPVCRQAFEKIIFNIRAMDDYDEQVVQNPHRHRFGPFHSPNFSYSLGTPFTNIDGNTRFRYPTPLRRRMIDFERRLQMQLHMTDYYHSFSPNNFSHFVDFLDNNRRSREQRSSRFGDISHTINSNNILRSNSSNTLDSRTNRSSTQTMPLSERNRTREEDPMLSGHTPNEWNPRFFANHFEMDIFPPPVGTSAHRRYIYDSDLYVLTNGDGNTQRTRDVSARFFSSNPACTHRLIPWLNRELNSILNNPNETETLIPRIMNALLMYDILSVGFKKIIAPFTSAKTDHFIHEFYNFARSPHDMDQYTRISVYVPRHRADIIRSEPLPAPIGYHIEDNSPNRSSPESISSSGSSIEILDESFNRINTPNNRQIATLSPPISLRVYSIDGSDSDESSTEIRQLITPSPVNTPSIHHNTSSEAVANNDVSSTSNPTPLPRGDLPDVNFGNIDIIDDFENPKPGTSGLSRMRTLAQTKWSDSETTDIEVGQELEDAIARFESNGRTEVKIENLNENKKVDTNNANHSDSSGSSVLIVGYVKPLHERTPEFVDLISSEDQDFKQNGSERHNKHRKSRKEKKGKHRKRSSGRSRSRSPESHSKHKRKCKHKSKDRFRDKSRDSGHHKRKSHRHSRSHRSSSTSSSSSSSSNYDELRQLNKIFKNKEYNQRKHIKFSQNVYKNESNRHNNQSNDCLVSPSTNKKTMASTTASSSRPSSLSSVVFVKDSTPNQSIKFRPYLIYSDSD